MLLHYITQDKIFSFPKHLPTQAGSCTQQAWAQLVPLCRLDFPLLPCPLSLLLISTGSNFTSIYIRKIKRDLIPKKVWIMHASADGGKTTSACSWRGATWKFQECLFQNQGRKIYCRHLGLTFLTSSYHTCHCRWAKSSSLCSGNPKHATSRKRRSQQHSINPSNNARRYQAAMQIVQGGMGLPHAQQTLQHWLMSCWSFKSLDIF